MNHFHEEFPPCAHCGSEADWVDDLGAICTRCLEEEEEIHNEEALANAEAPCNCDQALELQRRLRSAAARLALWARNNDELARIADSPEQREWFRGFAAACRAAGKEVTK